uniref:FIIND domain-containing protein n=1 Tax=Cyprinodon variegatus TaxID=28743 RepID=A0A3Q2GFS1_CYPVA
QHSSDPKSQSAWVQLAQTSHEGFGHYFSRTGSRTIVAGLLKALLEGCVFKGDLRSEAGRFECSVSGLRWFCQEKVAFRYRFCSWDGHMERMESRGYRPAGPLMDITVSTGTMLEVQLPHWVYIASVAAVFAEDVPELLDNFAVLHVTDYGDVLEKVAQVTETHVTLTEPAFSLLGCLLNIFFSPRINCCNTLIYYQPNKPFLKLHVYLILPDPALKQVLIYFIIKSFIYQQFYIIWRSNLSQLKSLH